MKIYSIKLLTLAILLTSINMDGQTLFSFDSSSEGWDVFQLGDASQTPVGHSSDLTTSSGCSVDSMISGISGGYIAFDDASGGTNFMTVGGIGQDLSVNLGGTFSFYWYNGTYNDGGIQDGTVTAHRMEFYNSSGQMAFIEIDVTGLFNEGWQLIEIPLNESDWSNISLSTILSDLDSMKLEVESISSQQFPGADCTNAEYMALDEISFSPQVLSIDLHSSSYVEAEVNEIFNLSINNVYPNPASDYIITSISSSNNGLLEFNFYTIDGKLLSSESVMSREGTTDFTFNISEIPPGTYILNVIDGTFNSKYHSIIIQ